jgi:hypothetical protein
MIRYGFCIRTKSGQRVDNIQILAATPDDAERRLRQMYVKCEILERREQSVPRRAETPEPQPIVRRARTAARSRTTSH